jgi:UDP-N-acetylglucosamine 1-carboxyvinyltransferase
MFLDEPSVTATENALMAASRATGVTQIRNAAAEPHVQDLCHMLVGMGCEIEGIGSGTLRIHGADRLRGGRFRVSPDHIEVGSFIGLAAVTRSEILIEDAAPEHLDSTLIGFGRLGIRSRDPRPGPVRPGRPGAARADGHGRAHPQDRRRSVAGVPG